MWIFGYGSLMWDRWEQTFDCSRKTGAILKDYARSFTKSSIRNWGSKAVPGPTLRVIPKQGDAVRGMAFEFPQDRDSAVLQYLLGREGGFTKSLVEIFLDGGGTVEAVTFTYQGKNIIQADDNRVLAEMVLRAHGTDGAALVYLRSCKKDLDTLGISDPAVDQLWDAVNQILTERKNLSN